MDASEQVVAALLVLVVWSDVVSTYFCYKRVKSLGFPKWYNEDSSPMYSYLVLQFGLKPGLIIAAFLNPLVFIFFAKALIIVFSTQFLMGLLNGAVGVGLSYGLFIGMIGINVVRNIAYYNLPKEAHNKRLLGEPVETKNS